MTNSSDEKLHVVIPAAGVGSRMMTATPKQYLPLGGRSVIEQSLRIFIDHERIAGIVVALAAEDSEWDRLAIDTRGKPLIRVGGGSERSQSVLNALDLLAQTHDPQDWVLVHDAARPCLRLEDLDRLLDSVMQAGTGGLLAVRVRDTMKRGDGTGRVARTVERQDLWHALTPQMFRLGELHQAMCDALEAGVMVTDESSAMEHAGYRPLLIEGSSDNIKITQPEDLRLAEFFLRLQGR